MHLDYLSIVGSFVPLMGGPIGVGAWLVGKKKLSATKIAGLLLPEDILLDLEASSKDQLFEQIGQHMERAHGVPRQSVTLSLSHREQIGSTGLGQGVAIPHARVKDLDRIRIAYARLKSPISFEAPDGKPVVDALVLMVPKQPTKEHLGILVDATRMLSGRRFREQLERCKRSFEIKRLFDHWPESRLGQ